VSFPRSPKRVPRKGRVSDRGRGQVILFPPGEAAENSAEASPPVLARMLPGVIAGAADLDPAAVLTATVAGATFGLSVAWVVLLCIPILRAVFGVAARIGHETRLGLVKLVREHFGKNYAIALACMVVAVNVIMVVADVMAVSDGLSIVLLQPSRFFPALVAFAVWYILTLVGYQKVNQTLSLVALFLFAYVAAAALGGDTVHSLTTGILLPHIPTQSAHGGSGYVLAIIAVFGSLLTPDVVVWQTSTKREGAGFYEAESRLGCVIAAFVSLSVIVAASHITLANPGAMTIRDAAAALAPLGELGPVLFALGIIGSGLVALPILVASLCFSISEAGNWDSRLSAPPWEARRFFILICVVLVLAVGIDYIGINTVQTLYWSQVLAGIFVVPILFFILWISNDRRIMRRTNTRWENFWLGGAVGGMLAANLVFFVAQVFW
jgi:Mn2+/Fe2+ NRAMP family transporter